MRRVLGIAALGAALAACGEQASGSPAHPEAPVVTGSAASCAGLTAAQQLRNAKLVMVGRMLRGRTVPDGERQVLASPARMRVLRYVKGHGPRVVRVVTAVTPKDGGVVMAEDGIEPRAGELWRIYTDSARLPYDTSICGGSRRVRG
jgi:hypothetical protein